MDQAIEEAIEKLRDAMVDLGWSQSEIARQGTAFAASIGISIKLSQQSVNGFLAGKAKRIPPWLQYVIGAIDQANPKQKFSDRFLTYRTEPNGIGKWEVPADRPPVVSASRDDDAIEIRELDLSYAMGDGSNLDDYPEGVGVKFDLGFLRGLTRAAPSKLFVARGSGDSMSPTLINDDMVLIDTSQKMLNMQDRIWACGLFGAGMIKRLRVIANDRVEIISDNPGVGNREVAADDLTLVGRVIWVGRRV